MFVISCFINLKKTEVTYEELLVVVQMVASKVLEEARYILEVGVHQTEEAGVPEVQEIWRGVAH